MHKIQRKLYKAYGKVANVLGEDFELFRTHELTDPLNPANFIDTKKASFSLNDKYTTTPKEGVNEWTCYTDGRLEALFDIQQGDFLRSVETQEKWMVTTAEVMLPIKAIKLPDTISVQRAGYGNSGSGFGPGDTEVATNIPCLIDDGNPTNGSLGYIPALNYQQEGRRVAIIWLNDANMEIEERDIVIDQNGKRLHVMSNERTPWGNKLIVQANEAS